MTDNSTNETRRCPRCAETIQAAAKVCRFCRAEFDAAGQAIPPAPNAMAKAPSKGGGCAAAIGWLAILGVGAVIFVLWFGSTQSSRLTPSRTLAPSLDYTSLPSPPAPAWTVSRSASDITDDWGIYANISVPYRGPYGSRTAAMHVRCHENTTAVFWDFDTFLGDDNYGDLGTTKKATVRLDSAVAETLTLAVSTDHESAGYWRGNDAIPFLRRVEKADKLVIRLTPMSESPVELTFDLVGLRAFLPEIKNACGWG